VIIDSFKGINNTVSARDIPKSALQDAVDVDITNSGGVTRRFGYQPALSVPITTSYTTFDGETYIVSNGFLYRVNPDLSLVALTETIATEFCDFSRTLFTNDGYSIYQDRVSALNIPTPTDGPEIVITAGAKPAGLYNILHTYSNSDGLEGGASVVITVELATPGEILVTPLPLLGFTSNIYMTEAGGEVFYDVRYGNQIAPPQVNSAPIPLRADKIEVFQSKLFVSERFEDYSIVWYSKPFHYHLFNYDTDYIVVPGKVEALKATSSVLVIATDREIYGYTSDGVLTPLAKYGVVQGRPIVRLPNDTVLIHTVRGVCSAMPFTPLTEARVSLPMGSSCSTAIVYNKGEQRFLGLHSAGGEAFNKF